MLFIYPLVRKLRTFLHVAVEPAWLLYVNAFRCLGAPKGQDMVKSDERLASNSLCCTNVCTCPVPDAGHIWHAWVVWHGRMGPRFPLYYIHSVRLAGCGRWRVLICGRRFSDVRYVTYKSLTCGPVPYVTESQSLIYCERKVLLAGWY